MLSVIISVKLTDLQFLFQDALPVTLLLAHPSRQELSRTVCLAAVVITWIY